MKNNWYKEPERNLNSNLNNNDTNNNNRNDDETKSKNILNSCSRQIDFFRERIGLNKKVFNILILIILKNVLLKLKTILII